MLWLFIAITVSEPFIRTSAIMTFHLSYRFTTQFEHRFTWTKTDVAAGYIINLLLADKTQQIVRDVLGLPQGNKNFLCYHAWPSAKLKTSSKLSVKPSVSQKNALPPSQLLSLFIPSSFLPDRCFIKSCRVCKSSISGYQSCSQHLALSLRKIQWNRQLHTRSWFQFPWQGVGN